MAATKFIYTHVLNRDGKGVQSPMDGSTAFVGQATPAVFDCRPGQTNTPREPKPADRTPTCEGSWAKSENSVNRDRLPGEA